MGDVLRKLALELKTEATARPVDPERLEEMSLEGRRFAVSALPHRIIECDGVVCRVQFSRDEFRGLSFWHLSVAWDSGNRFPAEVVRDIVEAFELGLPLELPSLLGNCRQFLWRAD
jgi:hypothetical protein